MPGSAIELQQLNNNLLLADVAMPGTGSIALRVVIGLQVEIAVRCLLRGAVAVQKLDKVRRASPVACISNGIRIAVKNILW
jgi:hypothetical protein